MNESEERYVDALEKENKKYEEQIEELSRRVGELEDDVEDWKSECDKLMVKIRIQESYICGVQDAVMLSTGGHNYDDIFDD